MELNEEFIKGLAVDEAGLVRGVAEALGIGAAQVATVIELFAEDCTVAFISRYQG